MAATYTTETIHGEKVKGGEIETEIDGWKRKVDVQQLRNAIPAHCFKPSTLRSVGYIVHDLAIFLALLSTTLYLEKRVDGVTRALLCYVAWPCLASFPLTGLWVLAHECGHGAFSTNKTVSNLVGWVLHSALMNPYFSWRSSHARHHQFANHIVKDLNYVPPMRDEYTELFRGKIDLDDLVEDAPAVVLIRIIVQQTIGWPWYLLTHITSGKGSSPNESSGWWDNSHFLRGSLFRPNEFWNIMASDAGIGLVAAALYVLGQRYGSSTMVWGYVIPWMIVNHWIVMITYLHHTAPNLPKYTAESWSYLRGALATVDRKPGAVYEHCFHHIIDYHVVHHLFPRIPHYHAREATEAIAPLLGDYYHVDRSNYWRALWVAFTQCQWVEADAGKSAKATVHAKAGLEPEAAATSSSVEDSGILWYRPGPMPSPAITMRT